MTLRSEITRQVTNLFAYFPGRGRIALSWLVLMPTAYILSMWYVVGKLSHVEGSPVPHILVSLSAMITLGMVKLALVMLLLRVTGRGAQCPSETVAIVSSSVIYSIIVFIPAFGLIVGASIPFAGFSFGSMAKIFTGIGSSIGSLLLLAGIFGWVIRRIPFTMPLFLCALVPATNFLPIGWTLDLLSDSYRILYSLCLPLAPAITLVKEGIMGRSAETEWIIWLGAMIHAVIGFGIAYHEWRAYSATEESN